MLFKYTYYTCATKCVVRYKVVPHYTFRSISLIHMLAKSNYGNSETSYFLTQFGDIATAEK